MSLVNTTSRVTSHEMLTSTRVRSSGVTCQCEVNDDLVLPSNYPHIRPDINSQGAMDPEPGYRLYVKNKVYPEPSTFWRRDGSTCCHQVKLYQRKRSSSRYSTTSMLTFLRSVMTTLQELYSLASKIRYSSSGVALVVIYLVLCMSSQTLGGPAQGRPLASGINKASLSRSTCVATFQKGVINLQPLAGLLQPRFTSRHHGYNYTFNPCISFSSGALMTSLHVDASQPITDCDSVNLCRWRLLGNGSVLCDALGDSSSARLRVKNKNREIFHRKLLAVNERDDDYWPYDYHDDYFEDSYGNYDDRNSSKENARHGGGNETDSASRERHLVNGNDKSRHWPSKHYAGKDKLLNVDEHGHDGDDDGNEKEENDSERENEEKLKKSIVPDITSLIKMKGKGRFSRVMSIIYLKCNSSLIGPEDARFDVIGRIQRRQASYMEFVLTHRCCCFNGCPLEGSTLFSLRDLRGNQQHDYDDNLEEHENSTEYDNNSTFTGNGTHQGMVGDEDLGPGANYIWLILVFNGGLLMSAVLVAGMCCQKSHSVTSSGQYSYLPALHASRFTLSGSSESMYVPGAVAPRRKAAAYLDYCSDLHTPAELPVLDNCIIAAPYVDFGQRLGGGLFCDTYLGEWKERPVAAKRITVGVHQNQLTEEDLAFIVKQVGVLSHQRHKNLASVMGVTVDTRQPYIITEFVDGETLKELLRRGPEGFSWSAKLKIGGQVADGLAFLHSAKPPLLHRDLRCANILVDKAERAKVVDYGLTRIVQRLREKCTGRTGCFCQKEYSAFPAFLRWTAPEVLVFPRADESNHEVFTTACDVYSYAMVLWEMASHMDPFDEIQDENDVLEEVLRGGRPHGDLTGTSTEYVDLMVKCWAQDPTARPALKQVAQDLKNMLQIQQKHSMRGHRTRTETTSSYLKSALSLGRD